MLGFHSFAFSFLHSFEIHVVFSDLCQDFSGAARDQSKLDIYKEVVNKLDELPKLLVVLSDGSL